MKHAARQVSAEVVLLSTRKQSFSPKANADRAARARKFIRECDKKAPQVLGFAWESRSMEGELKSTYRSLDATHAGDIFFQDIRNNRVLASQKKKK